MVELTIVIPAHNEEEILENTVIEIIKYVKIPDYEILICDDYSNDGTLNIATRLEMQYKHIRVVRNITDSGFGNIVRFGFKHARGKYIVLMMADLCDNPKTVNDMYSKMQEGYDCVIGSRYAKGGSKHNTHDKLKSFFSWLVGQISNKVLKINTCDASNAFKMIKKEVLNTLNLQANDFDISFEITIKLWEKNYKISEVSTIWIDRSSGKSKFKVSRVALKYMRWFFK